MLVNWESGPGWEKDSHPMDRTANCCNHGDWVHSGPCSGHHHVIYFSYWRMCGCHVYFPEMVTERGSMVKVPVKCAYFRLLLSSGLLSIPRCQSLSRSLFVSSTCVSQIFLRGVRRERKSPGKFSETNQKKKFRYERIVVKCLLLANLGNWTHAVLDLLWWQSWQFVAGIFILAFFVLLRTFLQFHAGIAGIICDVSSSLGIFRTGIPRIFCAVANFLAISRRHCWNDLWCFQ
jgi:hypothetical protein